MVNGNLNRTGVVPVQERDMVLRVLRTTAVTVFFFCIMHSWAFAEGMKAWLDYTYTDFTGESTTEATGTETDANARSFRQLYGLSLDRHLYPNLRFYGKLFAEFRETDSETETRTGVTSTRTESNLQFSSLRPFLDLTLRTEQLILGGNIAYRKEHTKISGSEAVTTYQIDKSAIIDWRPESIPSLQARYLRTESYDSDRSFRDLEKDYLAVSSKYMPVEALELRYYGSYTEGDNNINDTITRAQSHTGQAVFAQQFFGRADIYGSYQIGHSITEFESPGTGEFKDQVFANQGLFSVNDIPENDTMNPNPALIDGNRDVTAGINIGSSLPTAGDNRLRNIGLDFFSPETLDSIFVYVLSPAPQPDLTSDVATSLQWEVFVSDDNIDWVSWSQPSFVFYDPFQRRFEIGFPSVQTRYIKVTVRPLSLAVPGATAFPDLFVTEAEAFITIPVSGDVLRLHSTRQYGTFSSRIRLTEAPFIFYELTYTYRESDSASRSSKAWTLSNGLSLNHRITGWLTGGARVAREDSFESVIGRVTAYVYNASLQATPLETLRHSLVFSGRVEENPEGNYTTNSISLYNYAQLYQGIDANLSGGYTHQNTETGQRIDSTVIGAGMNIVPHRTASINLNYSGTETNRSGGGEPDSRDYTKRADASISYSPLRTLYLYGSWSWVERPERTDRIQNYNVSWAPFPGGALEISVAYTEFVRSLDNSRDRTLTPYLRWTVSRAIFLETSYSIFKSESDISTTDSQIFSTRLRINFL